MKINLDYTRKWAFDNKTFLALRAETKSKTQFLVSILTDEEIEELENDLLDTVRELVALRESR
jgi:hypothetical protein